MEEMKTKILLFFWLFTLLLTIPAYGEWDTSLSKDEMTGKKSAYASSSVISPMKIMDFPYHDVKAWIGIGHDNQSGQKWVYIGFTNSPNLVNSKIQSGYNLIYARIKWDDDLYNCHLTQKWGCKFLHFQQRDVPFVISQIKKSKTMLLELDWYGQGKTYFKFQLNGSSKALKKIRGEF
jgi:hypothetical protein